MKRFLIGLMVAAVAAVSFGGATAFASNGAKKTDFTATYPGSPGTTWTCSGTRMVNHGIGTRDKETCLITGDLTGYVNFKYSSDPSLTGSVANCPAPAGIGVGPFGPNCWSSDFDSALATSFTIRLKDNRKVPDSFTFSLTAFYNP